MSETLIDFTVNTRYSKVKALGDKLDEVKSIIDWDAFRAILINLYNNEGPMGGRPNIDVIVMLKMLFLQEWYALSDPELERQVNDRISFMHFLRITENIPDFSTVWRFRERLAVTGYDKKIWDELQRQLISLGYSIKKGTIQDATFIHSDPGPSSKKKDRDQNSKTRRSKDGTWTKKNGQFHFGYKLHTMEDYDFLLIRDFKTTTAAVNDKKIDLSRKGKVCYRDKGYANVVCRGYNGTMAQAKRNHSLSVRDTLRNIRIMKKRSRGERPYAVMKRVFHNGHTHLTNLVRVNVSTMFLCFCYNVFQLISLRKLAPRGLA